MSEALARLGSMFLVAGGEEAGQVHLGTAHLFAATGVRATPMRLLLRWIDRRGGDFAKHGNKVVMSVRDAADWLHVRLATGPISWQPEDLRGAISEFVRDNSLTVGAHEAS
jgi:hypothetical protein